MEALVSRDSFYAEEIDIFKAVRAWKEANPDSDASGIVICSYIQAVSFKQRNVLFLHVQESWLPYDFR